MVAGRTGNGGTGRASVDIGWRVRYARGRVHPPLSQRLLADRAGISRYWVGQVELGKATVSAESLATLFRVLVDYLPDLSPRWLLLGEGQAPEDRAPRAAEVAPALRPFLRGESRLEVGDSGDPGRQHAHRPPTLASLSAALVVDPERAASPLATDARLVADCERLNRALGYLRRTLPAAELLPLIEAHLASLRRRISAGSDRRARSLRSIAAGAATLGGWLCFSLERRQEARAYLSWAEGIAREIEDREVLMLILMLRADLASCVPTGGQEGLPEEARRLLDEGLLLAAPSAPACLEAPLLLRSAEEHAFLGAEGSSRRDLEQAERVLGAADRPGFYLRPDAGEPGWRPAVAASFRASCLQLLGQARPAVEVLQPVLAALPAPDRAAPLTDLAAAHAQAGDLDRACALLSDAVEIAAEHGQPGRGRRIAGVRRRHLARWEGEPALQRLDEELALAL
jgi:transcriptional regulator with XRE-family HTH domain